MPLTEKGEKIKRALVQEYGEKKGKEVLYAGKNKGTFTGIDSTSGTVDPVSAYMDACKRGDSCAIESARKGLVR